MKMTIWKIKPCIEMAIPRYPVGTNLVVKISLLSLKIFFVLECKILVDTSLMNRLLRHMIGIGVGGGAKVGKKVMRGKGKGTVPAVAG